MRQLRSDRRRLPKAASVGIIVALVVAGCVPVTPPTSTTTVPPGPFLVAPRGGVMIPEGADVTLEVSHPPRYAQDSYLYIVWREDARYGRREIWQLESMGTSVTVPAEVLRPATKFWWTAGDTDGSYLFEEEFAVGGQPIPLADVTSPAPTNPPPRIYTGLDLQLRANPPGDGHTYDIRFTIRETDYPDDLIYDSGFVPLTSEPVDILPGNLFRAWERYHWDAYMRRSDTLQEGEDIDQTWGYIDVWEGTGYLEPVVWPPDQDVALEIPVACEDVDTCGWFDAGDGFVTGVE